MKKNKISYICLLIKNFYNKINNKQKNLEKKSTPFENYCKDNPEALECKIFDL
jgi:hypothetical protein